MYVRLPARAKIIHTLIIIPLWLLTGQLQAATNVLYDDFDNSNLAPWSTSCGGDNATGWTRVESGTNLTVTDITDSTANGGWASCTITRMFGETVDDFEAQFMFAYDSLNSSGFQDVKAMQTLDITLVDSNQNTVIAFGLTDAWVSTYGELYGNIEGTSDSTGQGNAPSNISLDFTVTRDSGHATIHNGSGIDLKNIASTTPIAGVVIRFQFNYFSSTGPSFFGREWIDLVRVTKEPTIRVSTDSVGAQGNDYSNYAPVISDNGDYVAFSSLASNLASVDTGTDDDVFLKNTVSGTTTYISVNSSSGEGSLSSLRPDISGDGRYVAFESNADDLVATDIGGFADIFVRDTVTNTTSLVSANSSEIQGNGNSDSSAISDDGRYVVFSSTADNLSSADANGSIPDIFHKDTSTGLITLVSSDSSGNGGNSTSFSYPDTLSLDGRYVAFASQASNLAAADIDGIRDVFVKDTVSGATILVSTDSLGNKGNNSSGTPTISGNGRYVAFSSFADNLVGGDLNGTHDIFLKDLLTGNTTLISTDSNGTQGNSTSSVCSISADGRYVAFSSNADNLVTGDSGWEDVFIKDTYRNSTSLVSTNSVGTKGNLFSESPSISDDGHYIVFRSAADNLVVSDTNGVTDIFRVINPSYVADTDGDGLRDDVEAAIGTNPALTDTDGDTLSDYDEVNGDLDQYSYTVGAETSPLLLDTDGDTVDDALDGCPLDPAGTVDTDSDGICNYADPDDDGDGVDDTLDAFPLDPTETTDTDGDGTGDNADTDDDNDGLPDLFEAQLGSDPLVVDDYSAGLSGINVDSDGDGLSDFYEINVSGTDPNDPGDTVQVNAGPLGDINGDGVVNIGDLVVLQRMLLGLP